MSSLLAWLARLVPEQVDVDWSFYPPRRADGTAIRLCHPGSPGRVGFLSPEGNLARRTSRNNPCPLHGRHGGGCAIGHEKGLAGPWQLRSNSMELWDPLEGWTRF